MAIEWLKEVVKQSNVSFFEICTFFLFHFSSESFKHISFEFHLEIAYKQFWDVALQEVIHNWILELFIQRVDALILPGSCQTNDLLADFFNEFLRNFFEIQYRGILFFNFF